MFQVSHSVETASTKRLILAGTQTSIHKSHSEARNKKENSTREKEEQLSNSFFLTFTENKALLQVMPQNETHGPNFRFILWLQVYYLVLYQSPKEVFSSISQLNRNPDVICLKKFMSHSSSATVTHKNNYIPLVPSHWPNTKQAVRNKTV